MSLIPVTLGIETVNTRKACIEFRLDVYLFDNKIITF